MASSQFHPESDAPREITRRLSRFGGTNPFSKPNWRLCLADHRYDDRGGIFQELPDGNIKQFERDPRTGRMIDLGLKPDRVRTGIYPVPKYSHSGWILERWFPAHIWGTRAWWESQMAADGMTPILGEYPATGDYIMLAGPWEKLPDLNDIETAIARYNRDMDENPANWEHYMQSMTNSMATRRIERQAQIQAELDYFWKTEINPIWKSTTLAGSRLRNKAARDAGQTSHVTL